MRVAILVGALLLAMTACGSDPEVTADPDAGDQAAADRSTCLADAEAVTDFPEGYPADFPLPPQTVAYDAEDRGAEGVVVTGVTDLPFSDVLASLNGPAQEAGFTVTEGETEEHDAEANWTGNGFRGRWAIRESSSCPGETVVQVLALQE